MTRWLSDWLTDYSEIVAFGAALAGSLTTAELQYYYEKPHKWSLTRNAWVRAGRPKEWSEQ